MRLHLGRRIDRNSLGTQRIAVQMDLAKFTWHCEPQNWTLDDKLRIQPTARTDFWQRTHYGFQADNGHFLHCMTAGDFVLRARVWFHPLHQYDQAGLMVRVSSDCWLKCSVEFEPSGPSRLGVVVTNHGYSDWSTQNFLPTVRQVLLRIRREDDDYIVDASVSNERWEQLRMAHLHGGHGSPVGCGLYACSPKDSGFACEFDEISIVGGRVRAPNA